MDVASIGVPVALEPSVLLKLGPALLRLAIGLVPIQLVHCERLRVPYTPLTQRVIELAGSRFFEALQKALSTPLDSWCDT